MQNTQLKDNGLSRGFKLPAGYITQYQSWTDFLADACSQAGVSCDITGLRAAGVSVSGTAFSKDTMLPNSLEQELFGSLLASRTPAQAMEKLRTMAVAAQTEADGRCQIATGSYVGTGIAGPSGPTSITFPFAPKIVRLTTRRYGTDDKFYPFETQSDLICDMSVLFSDQYLEGAGFWDYKYNKSNIKFAKKSNDGKTLYWYHSMSDADCQCNTINFTYYWVAIG